MKTLIKQFNGEESNPKLIKLWLKDQGKDVTIVEIMDDILTVGGPLCRANHDMLKDLVEFKNINVECGSRMIKSIEEGFVIENKEKQEIIKADSAIVAIGYNYQFQKYCKAV